MGESLLLSDDLQATDLLWEFCFRTAFTIMSLFYSYVLFRFLFTSSKPYRAMIVYVFILFLLNTLVAWGFIALMDGRYGTPPDSEVLQLKSVYSFGMIAAFVSCIYSNTLYLESYIRVKDEKQRLELELLKEKETTLNAQFNFLKLQINPHFMFNNFSILSELIKEDKTWAG